MAGFAILATAISVRYDLNEWLYALTRGEERFQLDELPIGTGALLAGLVWFAWRRYREAAAEARARLAAETRLAELVRENRELAQENLRIQEGERKHLARELHDELGQYLNAIKLDAVSLMATSRTNTRDGAHSDEAVAAQAAAIVGSVDHLHRVVRDMIASLRPVGLDELGLVAAIEHCSDQWRQRLPDTRISLTVHGVFDDVHEDLSVAVYRVIQEGLTNIGKHADARVASITLDRERSPPTIHLIVADDGRGLSPESGRHHFGLQGMRERVEMAGGSFKLHSAPGAGVQIDVRLPE